MGILKGGEQRGRSWAGRAVIVVGGGLALVGANSLFHVVDSPIENKAKSEVAVGEVDVLNVVPERLVCVALAEATVPVDGAIRVQTKVFGKTVHTTTVISEQVAVKGDFEACARGEDTSISVTLDHDNPELSTAVVSISNVIANRPRVTNLGQPGSVEGGLHFPFSFTTPVDDREFAGQLQTMGQQVLGEGLCDQSVLGVAETGLVDYYQELATSFGVPAGNTSVSVALPEFDETMTPSQRGNKIFGDLFDGNLPKDFDVTIGQATCGTEQVTRTSGEGASIAR